MLRKVFTTDSGVKTTTLDTLAISPHEQFFSFKDITGLFRVTGFEIINYRGRTLACGFISDHLIKTEPLVKLNADLADLVGPYLVSDWMFSLEKSNPEKEIIPHSNLIKLIYKFGKREIARRI
jgi:hypothetical protein